MTQQVHKRRPERWFGKLTMSLSNGGSAPSGSNSRSMTLPGRVLIAGMFLVAALAVAGCTSGTYPVDIFYEQHYQQSYKSHEPPRLSGVASCDVALPGEPCAVAWYPAPPNTTDDSGAHLYEVNCQMCHGTDGRESGEVLQRLTRSPAEGGYGYEYNILDPETLEPRPPDLTVLTAEEISGYLANPGPARPFGPQSVMPPFGKLLSASERNAIIEYIGTLP